MIRTIFYQIYFQRKRELAFFFIVFSLILLYLGFQTMEIDKKFKQMSTPDLAIAGQSDSDGVIRFRFYKQLPGLEADLKQNLPTQVQTYGVVMRNILSTQNVKTLEKVEYSVIGVQPGFFSSQLAHSLKEGTLPAAGKKEAVLGAFAARYYQVKVGDRLPPMVTLREDLDESVTADFTVSGILNDDVTYFRGAVIVSRDLFPAQTDNAVIAYFKGHTDISRIGTALESLISRFPVGSVQSFYETKRETQRSAILHMAVIGAGALLMAWLLITTFMKGMTRKIGLMKALGVPNRVLRKINLLGFGSLIAACFLTGLAGTYAVKWSFDRSMSRVYGFSVEYYRMNGLTILSLLLMACLLFVILFGMIHFKGSRISPRSSMLDSH
ncbi:ABC transporter permease [Gorillibacterium sp. sgz500922]|uniref:ABC transporter permease n=1 Tax=Gorillibacterium sp. sgz500922 TaxID=3446694 RepID=UPI003F66FD06